MNEKLKAKLEELGFENTITDATGEFFSKVTTVGAPADQNGNKIYVYVAIQDGKCSIATDAVARHGQVLIEYTGIDEDFFARNLRTLERQVVYAWRELAD